MKQIEEIVLEILDTKIKSQKQVCSELADTYGIKMDARTLRKVYEGIREQFAQKEINFTILNCSKGNYISYDFESIKKDNQACRKTALAILKNAYARDKRIRNDDQLSFADYVAELDGALNG